MSSPTTRLYETRCTFPALLGTSCRCGFTPRADLRLSGPRPFSQTKSIANPDHQAIKALFGEVRVHPLYTLFPEAALSVTAAFLRTISANRLGKYLSRETEDLSHAEITAKTAWEDTYSSILSSITVSVRPDSR